MRKTKQKNGYKLRLPDALENELRIFCDSTDTPLSVVISVAVEEYLAKNKAI